LIDLVAGRLAASGARVDIVPGDEGRANLFATFGPAVAGGLLVSGHTDVVPAGTGWATPAYELTRRGDALHGRGSADMKGFIAALLCVLTPAAVDDLAAPLHVALSYDEEVGCVGVRGLLSRLAERADVRPALVLIGEPTMMRPRHAHQGKVAFDLTFTSRAGHSSRSHSLPSAIASAARVVVALDEMRDDPDVTVNCGVVHGGTALNVIAERCELTFELRHSTAADPDALLRPIWATIDGERRRLAEVGGGVEVVETVRYPAMATDPSDAMLALVERLADAGPAVPLGFGAEGGLFARALGAPVVVCGPGDIDVAHRADEHVPVDQLRRCTELLSSVIDALCRAGDATVIVRP
jgi:acetylornithine deacetylase